MVGFQDSCNAEQQMCVILQFENKITKNIFLNLRGLRQGWS